MIDKKEYKNKWYQENKDTVKAKKAKWYQDNRDRLVQKQREYYQKNKKNNETENSNDGAHPTSGE